MRDYIEVYGAYRHIYCFEVSPYNVEELKKNIAAMDNISIVQKAAGKIPRMIKEMRSDYRFYLRSNGMQLGPSEIVLFAIPESD